MSTVLPANVAAYFESLVPVVQYDLLESETLSPANVVEFDFKEHKSLEWKIIDQLKNMGYETHNAILNLGTIFVLASIYLIKVFIFLLFSLI
jgi:hypothetical protein